MGYVSAFDSASSAGRNHTVSWAAHLSFATSLRFWMRPLKPGANRLPSSSFVARLFRLASTASACFLRRAIAAAALLI